LDCKEYGNVTAVVAMTGGGIKGAVAAARYASDHELLLVHADYGQPAAAAEARALRDLAGTLASSRVLLLTLPHVLELDGRSAKTVRRTQTEEGRLEKENAAPSPAVLRGLMPVLMSTGIQCAMRVGASTVITGLSRSCDAVHLGVGDRHDAADRVCEFIHAFNLLCESLVHGSSKIRVEAPLMEMPLPQIIKLARHFDVPLEKTWTCDRAGPTPCGTCEPCKSRSRAFTEAALIDPLVSSAPVPA